MDALFADPDVDAVLLVLPIPMMPAAVESALRAGKHVLSEKPAAPNLDAALHLLTLLHTLGPRAPAWIVLENWACVFLPSILRSLHVSLALNCFSTSRAFSLSAG